MHGGHCPACMAQEADRHILHGQGAAPRPGRCLRRRATRQSLRRRRHRSKLPPRSARLLHGPQEAPQRPHPPQAGRQRATDALNERLPRLGPGGDRPALGGHDLANGAGSSPACGRQHVRPVLTCLGHEQPLHRRLLLPAQPHEPRGGLQGGCQRRLREGELFAGKELREGALPVGVAQEGGRVEIDPVEQGLDRGHLRGIVKSQLRRLGKLAQRRNPRRHGIAESHDAKEVVSRVLVVPRDGRAMPRSCSSTTDDGKPHVHLRYPTNLLDA
mmetsp:Transcript_6163/g.16779  ORF Transcript_6163/g.16779 Transcript_6163/m.16779 type:complete len:272 (-) Transcript_6163:422-1237(-)